MYEEQGPEFVNGGGGVARFYPHTTTEGIMMYCTKLTLTPSVKRVGVSYSRGVHTVLALDKVNGGCQIMD